MLNIYSDEYQRITFDGQQYEWSDINGHSFVLKDEMDARIYAAQLTVEHQTIEMCSKIEDRFEAICGALEERTESLEIRFEAVCGDLEARLERLEIALRDLIWKGVAKYEDMNR